MKFSYTGEITKEQYPTRLKPRGYFCRFFLFMGDRGWNSVRGASEWCLQNGLSEICDKNTRDGVHILLLLTTLQNGFFTEQLHVEIKKKLKALKIINMENLSWLLLTICICW